MPLRPCIWCAGRGLEPPLARSLRPSDDLSAAVPGESLWHDVADVVTGIVEREFFGSQPQASPWGALREGPFREGAASGFLSGICFPRKVLPQQVLPRRPSAPGSTPRLRFRPSASGSLRPSSLENTLSDAPAGGVWRYEDRRARADSGLEVELEADRGVDADLECHVVAGCILSGNDSVV